MPAMTGLNASLEEAVRTLLEEIGGTLLNLGMIELRREDLAAAITTLLTNVLGLSPAEVLQSSSRTNRLRGGGRSPQTRVRASSSRASLIVASPRGSCAPTSPPST